LSTVDFQRSVDEFLGEKRRREEDAPWGLPIPISPGGIVHQDSDLCPVAVNGSKPSLSMNLVIPYYATG
jgi:hypothetical protein